MLCCPTVLGYCIVNYSLRQNLHELGRPLLYASPLLTEAAELVLLIAYVLRTTCHGCVCHAPVGGTEMVLVPAPTVRVCGTARKPSD